MLISQTGERPTHSPSWYRLVRRCAPASLIAGSITLRPERMRRAHEAKVRKVAEESHEHQAELLNQSYARSREIARQGVVPFKFVLDERLEPKAEKMLSPSKRTDPE